jgi:hypothetical protein
MHTALADTLKERITCIEDALLQIEQHTEAVLHGSGERAH